MWQVPWYSCGDVSGQLSGVGCLLSPHVTWANKVRSLAWQQMLSSPEPSHQPQLLLLAGEDIFTTGTGDAVTTRTQLLLHFNVAWRAAALQESYQTSSWPRNIRGIQLYRLRWYWVLSLSGVQMDSTGLLGPCCTCSFHNMYAFCWFCLEFLSCIRLDLLYFSRFQASLSNLIINRQSVHWLSSVTIILELSSYV